MNKEQTESIVKVHADDIPPIKSWADSLRWGIDPKRILTAIQGWVNARA